MLNLFALLKVIFTGILFIVLQDILIQLVWLHSDLTLIVFGLAGCIWWALFGCILFFFEEEEILIDYRKFTFTSKTF